MTMALVVERNLPALPRGILHIPFHFQACQQFDVAGDVVGGAFLVALFFCARTKLRPFVLQGIARLLLVVRALPCIGLVPPSNWHSRAISSFGMVSAPATGCSEARMTIGRWASLLFSGVEFSR